MKLTQAKKTSLYEGADVDRLTKGRRFDLSPEVKASIAFPRRIVGGVEMCAHVDDLFSEEAWEKSNRKGKLVQMALRVRQDFSVNDLPPEAETSDPMAIERHLRGAYFGKGNLTMKHLCYRALMQPSAVHDDATGKWRFRFGNTHPDYASGDIEVGVGKRFLKPGFISLYIKIERDLNRRLRADALYHGHWREAPEMSVQRAVYVVMNRPTFMQIARVHPGREPALFGRRLVLPEECQRWPVAGSLSNRLEAAVARGVVLWD